MYHNIFEGLSVGARKDFDSGDGTELEKKRRARKNSSAPFNFGARVQLVRLRTVKVINCLSENFDATDVVVRRGLRSHVASLQIDLGREGRERAGERTYEISQRRSFQNCWPWTCKGKWSLTSRHNGESFGQIF
jgi:hypothetical protein